jgi:hypothetical protein
MGPLYGKNELKFYKVIQNDHLYAKLSDYVVVIPMAFGMLMK